MRLGAIDVGTNSCRLLLADWADDQIRVIEQGLITTRLGKGVGRSGELKLDAVERTLNAIKQFCRRLTAGGAEKIKIVGTSALRDVSNPELLLDRVQAEIDCQLEVIDGRQEAYLVYLGVSLDLSGDDLMVIDIGGGSTEFIWPAGGDLQLESLNMGAVRMTEGYLANPADPLDEAELHKVSREVDRLLENRLGDKIEQMRDRPAAGVGGTITTLAAIDLGLTSYHPQQIQHYWLSLQRVQKLITELSVQSLEQRRNTAGLQAERADIIVTGALILEAVMNRLRLKGITVSDHGILYGIIRQMTAEN